MPELPPQIIDFDIIRENQRFSTYKASYEGHQVFVKQISDSALLGNIEREAKGLEIFSQMAAEHDIGFAVPQLVLQGEDYVVTSWAKGEPLVTDSVGITPEQIEFLAKSLVAIDRYAPAEPGVQVVFDIETTKASESVGVLHSRLEQAVLPDYVEPELIHRGFTYLAKHLDTLKPRLAHADINPSNIIESHGKYTLIDYEFTSLAWPRFYDLVNLTIGRIVLFPDIAPGFQRLAERYFEINDAIDPNASKLQINTIAMYRTLSLVWELATKPNQFHNTGQVMTPEMYARQSSVFAAIMDDKLYFEAQL